MLSSAAVPIEPLRVSLDEGALEDLRARLGRSRLPLADTEGWERGVPGHWLAGLLADWRTFDSARFAAWLNRVPHLQASLTGQRVHLVHLPGRGPDPLPLVLTHGWPSSFCEYLDLLPLLTDPAAQQRRNRTRAARARRR
jgi:hypothetical protein